MKIDDKNKNKNTKLVKYITLEIAQIDEYNNLHNIVKSIKPPSRYKKIKLHLIFDIKYGNRCKACCGANCQLLLTVFILV